MIEFNKKIWSAEEEKGRTADHLFLLKSIIDTYKQKKKKRVELLTISFR
jgi:hypothetical protein